eukprot:3263783-Ditylum_brightwellii.AAC.1
MSYGLDIRPATDEEKILHHHKHWGMLKSSLMDDIKYPIKKSKEEERMQTLEGMLIRSIHKSTKVEENKKKPPHQLYKE